MLRAVISRALTHCNCYGSLLVVPRKEFVMNKFDKSITPHRDTSIPANYKPVVPNDDQIKRAEKTLGRVVSTKRREEGSK